VHCVSFHHTPPSEIYPLSLHDALPISSKPMPVSRRSSPFADSIKNGCTWINNEPGRSFLRSFAASKGMNFLEESTENEPSNKECACMFLSLPFRRAQRYAKKMGNRLQP